MRTTKKLLSLLLALCMVVSLLPATALAAEETVVLETLQTTTPNSALVGTGTKEDPYLIRGLEDLILFRDTVDMQAADGSTQYANKYIRLETDIDLSGINWNPIGSMSGDHGSFRGIFDGNGHTISNLNCQQDGDGIGLFARTSDKAEIKNLTLENVTVKSTNNKNYVGAVVGNSYASTKISNVHVTGNIDISGRGYIGGISGHGYVVMDNVSVKGSGTIKSTFWCAGGILGYGAEGSTRVSNAVVEGTTENGLTITSAAGGLGAIVGRAEDNNGTQPISGENLSAKNVNIATYRGGYGENYANYALGYLFGGDTVSKLTGKLSIENVVITTSNGETPKVTDVAASIGNLVYADLVSAINAATDGETITLLRDVTANITVPADKNITLDLNGKVLTGALNEQGINVLDTIKVDGGSLTVKDSTAGQPVVDAGMNVTYQSGAVKNIAPTVKPYTQAISVVNGGKLVLENGTIYSEDSDGIYVSGEGSSLTMNGGYVYSNDNGYGIGGNVKATLNIHGGVVVADDNAAVGGNGSLGQGDTTFNITGGTMIGHMSDTARANGYIACGVYHPQAGTLNISGGTIYADRGVGVEMRGGTLNMTGGSVIATGNDSGKVGDSKVAANCYGIQIDGDSNYYDYGNCKVNISGNTFVKSDNGVPCVIVTPKDGQKKMTISGGLFSSDPSDYCAEGMTGVTNTDSATNADYPYAVGEKVEGTTPAVVESTTVPANTPAGASDDVKNIAKEMTGGADVKQDTVLEGAIKNAANNNKIDGNSKVADEDKTVTEALTALGSSVQEEEVAIVYQPYVDVTVTDAKKDDKNKVTSFTADLTPMYRVVATTNDVVENNTDIEVSGDAGVTNANAVLVESGKELNGLADRQYEVKLALPDGFAVKGERLCIKHEKNGSVEYYTGTVSDDGKFVTFITNGFSPFTVYAASESAASIGDNVYPTLQAAVDAVENNGIIKLLKDGETATVSRTLKFTVEPDNKTYTITAGANTTVTNEGHKYTCVYTAPTYTGPSGYAVKTEVGAHGKLTVSSSYATKGTTVTVTVTPDKGYVLSDLTVTDKNGNSLTLTDKGNGKYTFVMPDGAVTVKAAFGPESLPFTDVSVDAYYANAVKWAVDKGVTSGLTATTFGPNESCTRAQMVTFLWRAAGSPVVNYAMKFTDVPADAYYAEAVRWAVSKGITAGLTETTFGPEQTVTRGQVVAFLYRQAGSPAVGSKNPFTDVASDAYYADAVKWAVAQKITAGTTDTTFSPNADCTRGQIVTFLYNDMAK